MREGEYIILDNGKQTSERGGFNNLIFFFLFLVVWIIFLTRFSGLGNDTKSIETKLFFIFFY